MNIRVDERSARPLVLPFVLGVVLPALTFLPPIGGPTPQLPPVRPKAHLNE